MEYDPNRNWRAVEDGGFNAHLGPVWFSRTDETTSQIALKIEQKHINYGGVCHGGVYMAIADVAMGVTAARAMDRAPCATIDFRGHFLAAAKLGNWLVAEARVNRAVSGIVFMEAELWSSGRKCFLANGIWKRLDAKTGQTAPV